MARFSLPVQTRAVGSVIYTFHAVDLDSGTNGEITFSLEAPVSTCTCVTALH